MFVKEKKFLRKAKTASFTLKLYFLELDENGWGLGVDAPARESTEKWLSAIDVSERSVIRLRLMHLHQVCL